VGGIAGLLSGDRDRQRTPEQTPTSTPSDRTTPTEENLDEELVQILDPEIGGRDDFQRWKQNAERYSNNLDKLDDEKNAYEQVMQEFRGDNFTLSTTDFQGEGQLITPEVLLAVNDNDQDYRTANPRQHLGKGFENKTHDYTNFEEIENLERFTPRNVEQLLNQLDLDELSQLPASENQVLRDNVNERFQKLRQIRPYVKGEFAGDLEMTKKEKNNLVDNLDDRIEELEQTEIWLEKILDGGTFKVEGSDRFYLQGIDQYINQHFDDILTDMNQQTAAINQTKGVKPGKFNDNRQVKLKEFEDAGIETQDIYAEVAGLYLNVASDYAAVRTLRQISEEISGELRKTLSRYEEETETPTPTPDDDKDDDYHHHHPHDHDRDRDRDHRDDDHDHDYDDDKDDDDDKKHRTPTSTPRPDRRTQKLELNIHQQRALYNTLSKWEKKQLYEDVLDEYEDDVKNIDDHYTKHADDFILLNLGKNSRKDPENIDLEIHYTIRGDNTDTVDDAEVYNTIKNGDWIAKEYGGFGISDDLAEYIVEFAEDNDFT
jgi:hypothetical protein